MSRYRFGLRFLICKIRIIIVPILQGCCESQTKQCMEAIGIVLQAILKVNSNFTASAWFAILFFYLEKTP